ncbi:MAG TPA: S41 family peptidase [Alphaproteobacteria bacterium]|nr:S41 family peptidase [Alphaproteobacteria bacterium]
MRKFAPAALIVLVLFAFPSVGREEQTKSDIFGQLNLLGDVIERVRQDYVEPVNDQKMIEAAINGMLTSLDPHSSYMNAKMYRDMQVQTRGEFGGLGIQVTLDNNLIKVISPIDGTPAAKAGIKAGDYITELDGESVVGMTLSDAVEKMRGPVNSSIKLTIARPGKDKPFNVALTREIIQIKPVKFHAERDVGYIRISSFNEQTDAGVKEALTKLPKEIGPNKLRGYIIDLRDNPGGLLDQAIAVVDDFVDHGEIVSTRGRRPEDTQRYNAKPGDMAHGKPLIVLINGGSASASEIVAGALQDHRRAVILGTRSFGKGSVQTIIPLGTHGALRLTTARYYTPAERSIQAKGIEPDIVVHQAKVEPINGQQRLHEADLRGHLAAPKPVDTGAKQDSVTTDAEGTGDESASKTDDYQLSYALDLLRGISLVEASKEN